MGWSVRLLSKYWLVLSALLPSACYAQTRLEVTVKLIGPKESLAGKLKASVLSTSASKDHDIENDLTFSEAISIVEGKVYVEASNSKGLFYKAIYWGDRVLSISVPRSAGYYSDLKTNNSLVPLIFPKLPGKGLYQDFRYENTDEISFLLSRRNQSWIQCHRSGANQDFEASDKSIKIAFNGDQNSWTDLSIDIDDKLLGTGHSSSKIVYTIKNAKLDSDCKIPSPDELVRSCKHIFGDSGQLRVGIQGAETASELDSKIKQESQSISTEQNRLHTKNSSNLVFRIVLALLAGFIAYFGLKHWNRTRHS